jgi:mannose-6-phosphate isomerase-like protein (cupin superfamily)
VVACSLLVGSCTPAVHVIVPDTQGTRRTDVSTLLRTHPLPEGQNISALLLERTEFLSYHLVQIRDRESPHVHAKHDLVVTLLRGRGWLYIRDTPRKMRTGDIAVVGHGTPHFFVNSDSTPAAAFVTFAPPYDGADRVPVGP